MPGPRENYNQIKDQICEVECKRKKMKPWKLHGANRQRVDQGSRDELWLWAPGTLALMGCFLHKITIKIIFYNFVDIKINRLILYIKTFLLPKISFFFFWLKKIKTFSRAQKGLWVPSTISTLPMSALREEQQTGLSCEPAPWGQVLVHVCVPGI